MMIGLMIFFEKAGDLNTKAEEAEAARIRAEEERQAAERSKQQAKGQSALEARFRAQKQALEAKKKLELEKKAKQKDAQATARVEAEFGDVSAASSIQSKREGVSSQALVAQDENTKELNVRHARTKWDSGWEHQCAGERRSDGSAIFCHPCNKWISLVEPFDHCGFELHCEKIGHYGWID